MKLQGHTNLASRLQSRLPAGTNLTTASAGFRNLGQFVAAVNVCHNLGIPFAELKTRMVERHMSLGQVIQDARPTAIHSTTIASQGRCWASAKRIKPQVNIAPHSRLTTHSSPPSHWTTILRKK